MSEPGLIFSLSDIGLELDEARQRRASREADPIERDTATAAGQSEPSASPISATSTLSTDCDSEPERLPLCLLCFTRPPSAVLLPCCHLNLCHLCAPLLLLKHRRPSPSPSSSPSQVTSALETERTPFNQALLRASANHPKSRRLSMGYCDPPDRGTRGGGEMRGQDLLEIATDGSRDPSCRALGGRRDEDGKINLKSEDDLAAGRCLICRAGVSGWLRVYSG